MGSFARIYVPCPSCNESVEFQSKSGSRVGSYDISCIAEKEVKGILGDMEFCPNCGYSVEIKDKGEIRRDYSHLVD